MGTTTMDLPATLESEPDPDPEPPSSCSAYQSNAVSLLYAVEENNFVAHHASETDISRSVYFCPKEAPTAFRKRFFPRAKLSDWENWHWQMRHRIHTFEQLARFIELSNDECSAFDRYGRTLPLSMTPYYLSLIDPDAENDPIRRCIVPNVLELNRSEEENDDPLGEEEVTPVPGLVHRYPDRVLFLATNLCSTYCRYCTRSRLVGKTVRADTRKHRWMSAIDYIQKHSEIRDVLISGGDPLTLSDDELDWILSKLRSIAHVEIIRIGTKVPAVMPQRITDNLVTVLKRYHPLFMSLHFTHPVELTPEAGRACEKLADAGIPLGSQTVLLKGINDDVKTMKQLFQGLLQKRVRPYYLYQCDRIPGSHHFTSSVAKGLEIIRGLRGHTSGYAIPQYVIDAPNGGGKIPMLPQDFIGCENGNIVLRNYTDRIFLYPDVSLSPNFATDAETDSQYTSPMGKL